MSAAVSDDEGRFLVIRRADNGHWEPPGGVLELGESIEEALMREVAEETGFAVQPLKLTGVYKNMQRGVVALVFRCRIVGGTARPPGAEVDEITWLAANQLSWLSEAFRVRLLNSLDTGAPHVRAHDGVNISREPTARARSDST